MVREGKYLERHHKSTLTEEALRQLLPNPAHYIFFETGTNLGAACKLALKVGCKKVISIEPQLNLFQAAQKRLQNTNALLILGNSRPNFHLLLEELDKNAPIFFWLDGHIGDESSLMYEIESIVRIRRNAQDVIAADDIRLIRRNKYWGQKINLEGLEGHLRQNNWKVSYVNNTMEKNDILIGRWQG